MNVPTGKTSVKAISDETQGEIKKGDIGYIDGYVQAADSRPYAIFVRLSDGKLGFMSFYQLQAIEAKATPF